MTKSPNVREDAFYGHLDAFDGLNVMGWAYTAKVRFSKVDIFLDDLLLGTAIADQFRPDLKEAGVGNGACAFSFMLAPHLISGARQKLSVRHSGTTIELTGSPTTVIGVPTGARQMFTEDLLKNTTFTGATNDVTPIGRGSNIVAPHVWVEASKSAVGRATYQAGVFKGLRFSEKSAARPGLRIRSDVPDSHVRVFIELWTPNWLLLSAVTATFRTTLIGTTGETPTVKLSTGYLEDGKFHATWSRKVRRLLPDSQEHRLVIEPKALNELSRKTGTATQSVLLFDILGAADLTLAGLELELGKFHNEPLRDAQGEFEDPVVADQWQYDFTAPTPASMDHSDEWGVSHVLNVPEIIVPVFNAPHVTLECLKSVIQNTNSPHLLTIVDDGSFPETSAVIRDITGDRPWRRVIRPAHNSGYTRAINSAIKTSAGNVIVVLNSDTIVTKGWLDGLLRCLNHDPGTGMAGPLSNAATWQSIPHVKDGTTWAINSLPAGESAETMAETLRAHSRREYPGVPVLNGFCIAIKREVFRKIGLFDEITFPMGYGEENDFCMRAADAGYTLRIADDTYVYHHKSKSFGSTRRNELTTTANRILSSRYGTERLKNLTTALASCEPLNRLRERISSDPSFKP